MGQTRSVRHSAKVALAALTGFALIAAACSDKKNEDGAPGATPSAATTVAPGVVTTAAPADSVPPDSMPGATTSSAPAVKPTPGGSIVVSGEAQVASPWTPAKVQCDPYCMQRALTFFDPLAAFGADGKVHPYLAESITPNSDATVWSVTLRPGITFTDGAPVDADAVIYNLQTTAASTTVAAALADLAKNPDGSLKIDKTGELSFDVYTGRDGDPNAPTPWFTFGGAFATLWGLIASPTWLKAVAAGTASETAPVGSGPFTVKSYSDEALVVVRNPDYWQKDAWGQQLPYLDQITFRVIPDSEVAAEALRNGDIQVFATSISQTIADLREEAAKFPMIEITEWAETNQVLLHLTNPVLADRRVRCALSKAIDRTEMLDATGGGIGTPANGIFSPGQQGYLEDNGFDTAQDLDGAKQLIDDYTAETGIKPSIILGLTASSLNERNGELFKGYWDAIGVETKVQMVEQSSFITNALLGVPEFQAYGWRQFGGIGADGKSTTLSSRTRRPDGEISLNFSRLDDPVIDENLDKVRQSADPADQEAAAQAINREMAEQCWLIPISWAEWGIPHAPALRGFGETMLPDGSQVAAADGAAGSGVFWTNSLWLAK